MYQNFLLAAVKLHCHRRRLGRRARGRPSPKLVHAAIAQGVRFMEDAVRRHSAAARATLGARGGSSAGTSGSWVRLLRNPQKETGEARGDAEEAGEKLRAPGMRAAARTLEAVVDERLSSVFREIRF